MSMTPSVGNTSRSDSYSKRPLFASSQNGEPNASQLFDLLLQMTPKSSVQPLDPTQGPVADEFAPETDSLSAPKADNERDENKSETDESKDKTSETTSVVGIEAWLQKPNLPATSETPKSFLKNENTENQSAQEVSIAKPGTDSEPAIVDPSTTKASDSGTAEKSLASSVTDQPIDAQTKSLDPSSPATTAPAIDGQIDPSISQESKAKNTKDAPQQISTTENTPVEKAEDPKDRNSKNQQIHENIGDAGTVQQTTSNKNDSSNEDRPTKRETRLKENRRGDDSERPTRSANASDTQNTNIQKQDVSNQETQRSPEQSSPVASPISNATEPLPPVAAVANAASASAIQSSVAPTVSIGKTIKEASPTVSGVASATSVSESRATNASTSSSGGSSITPRQEIRLVQRVLRGFEQLGNGDGQVKLRLHPPQLGSLQMTVRIDGSQVTAKLEVENALAQDALNANLPKLKEKLAEQGLYIEKFEVQITPANSSNESTSSSFNTFSGQQQEGRGDSGSQQAPGNWRDLNWQARQSENRPTAPIATKPIQGSGLDLVA